MSARVSRRERANRRSGRHDVEIAPQLAARQAQLLDRGTDHVLGDDDSGVGCDEDALGRDRAVRGTVRSVVQRRDRRNELPHDAQCRVDIELESMALGNRENV